MKACRPKFIHKEDEEDEDEVENGGTRETLVATNANAAAAARKTNVVGETGNGVTANGAEECVGPTNNTNLVVISAKDKTNNGKFVIHEHSYVSIYCTK